MQGVCEKDVQISHPPEGGKLNTFTSMKLCGKNVGF